MKQNPVVHFEMPAEDRQRMSKFYTEAFGWKTQQLGPEMGDYVMAYTAETDDNGMVQTPGAINGGFYQKTDDAPVPSLVISVDDINEAVQKIKNAGGTDLSEPMEIPGVGTWVTFKDTEGNRVSIMKSAY